MLVEETAEQDYRIGRFTWDPDPPPALADMPGARKRKPTLQTFKKKERSLVMSVNIREATLNDIDAIHETWLAAWKVLYQGGEPLTHSGGLRENAGVLAKQMQAGAICLVAEKDGKIIGVVRCRAEEGDTYHLYRMAVPPEARRRGVGESLIRAVEQAAYDRGARKISLRCIAEMGLPDYYSKMGFQVINRSPNVNSGGKMTDVRMLKDISPPLRNFFRSES